MPFGFVLVRVRVRELEETQCNNLKLHYDAYVSDDAVDYDELPHHEKITVKSFVANELVSNLNIGVNLIIDLANIFNPADIRENVCRLGTYLGSLSLKQSDNLQQRFNDTETERRKLAELPWRVIAIYGHRNGHPRSNASDWLTASFRTTEPHYRNRTARSSKITTDTCCVTATLFALQTRARERPYWHLTIV